MNRLLLVVSVFIIKTISAFAQAPEISYPGPQQYYTTNITISPLTPANKGGAVPAIPYANVTTFAGSGSPGLKDGTGSAASFYFPKTLAVDATGNVYVADYQGHKIRKVSPSGLVTTLAGTGATGSADGPAASATFSYPVGIAVDAAGSVYVTDQSSKIRRISPQGMVSTFAGTGAFGKINGPVSTATFNSPTGLAVDASGNVFVADQGNHLVRKISSSGIVSTLFSGSGTDFSTPAGLAVDASGTVYVADLGGKIRKITTDGIATIVAGSGSYGNSDGQGTAASFYSPKGIAVDASGNIYVADSYNNNIRMITTEGMVSTIAGTYTYGFNNGVGTASLFYTPSAIGLDKSGNAYVADEYNHMIRKITLTGYRITPALPAGLQFDSTTGTISGSATTISPATNYTVTATNAWGNATATVSISVGIPAIPPTITELAPASASIGSTILVTGANLLGASGATVGGVPAQSFSAYSSTKLAIVVPPGATSGAVVVSSAYGTATIAGFTLLTAPVISYPSVQTYYIGYSAGSVAPSNSGSAVPATTFGQISTFAGSGLSGFTDTIGTVARFRKPFGMAVDAEGNVFVSDQINNRIRKISTDGTVVTFAGKESNGSSTDGIGKAATFNVPSGVAVDASGNVYVADKNAHKIRKITSEGVVSTIAGNGLQGTADGPGSFATFNYPEGLTTDPSGNVYVADASNNRIRKITPQGIVSTIAGNGGYPFGNDGTGTNASFYMPTGVAADPYGNIFVTDRRLNKIRKITALGEVSTFAGTGNMESTDGPASLASFRDPNGIAVDPATGHLLVTEASTHALRFLSPSGYVTTLTDTSDNHNPTIFSYPEGVAFDGRGNAYIADANHYIIKKIVLTGYTISPSLPEGLSFDSRTGTLSGIPTAKNPATEYTITAFNSGGSSIAKFNLTITDPPPPTITSVSSSSAISGTTVTITGTFLLGATSVTFGGTPAQSFNVVSPTSITAVVGAGASGDVSVSTPYGTGILPGFTFVFSLPANTLKVTTHSVTCQGSANGSIRVLSALQNSHYIAVLSKDGSIISTSNFTDSTTITNLSAGNYTVCVTLSAQSDFKQCFTAVVEEPKDLSVYTLAVNNNEVLLQLAGALQYNLTLNGRNYSTSESQITLPVRPGNNTILVSSDLSCQGVVERNVSLFESALIYPNPFENTLNVLRNNETSTLVSVFTQDGKKLFTRTYKTQETISLDLSSLSSGLYLLKLSTQSTDSVHRIIKK